MENRIAAAQVNRLFTHCLEQLEQHDSTTSPRLSDAQNALLAYLRLDKIAEDEGFATLIAQGYGDELLCDNLAEQLTAWNIPMLPDMVLQARNLYHELGAAIGQHGDAATLRESFPQFAAVDEWYFMECEEIFPKVYNHVRRNFDEFVALLDFQAAS
nr:DUF4375 domain-containing protein [uncultured Kingella sp.]